MENPVVHEHIEDPGEATDYHGHISPFPQQQCGKEEKKRGVQSDVYGRERASGDELCHSERYTSRILCNIGSSAGQNAYSGISSGVI